MLWDSDVKIIKRNGYVVCKGNIEMKIDYSEEYLVEATLNGISDDEKLKKIIMKHEGCNDILANIYLVKFLLKYGEFLKEDNGNF